MTISKYIYVTCKHHNESQFNERYRLQYSQTEVTKTRSAIQNNIIRKSLEYLEIDEPIHISISSDLPTGSGLGSSSSFTVALLYGLKTLFQMPTNQFEIAEEAFEVERLINGDAIGRQDNMQLQSVGLTITDLIEKVIKCETITKFSNATGCYNKKFVLTMDRNFQKFVRYIEKAE